MATQEDVTKKPDTGISLILVSCRSGMKVTFCRGETAAAAEGTEGHHQERMTLYTHRHAVHTRSCSLCGLQVLVEPKPGRPTCLHGLAQNLFPDGVSLTTSCWTVKPSCCSKITLLDAAEDDGVCLHGSG